MTDICSSDSYLIVSENKLLKNATESVDMETQRNAENSAENNKKSKKSKTWTVTRSYNCKFSCDEVTKRLIKIHCNMEE